MSLDAKSAFHTQNKKGNLGDFIQNTCKATHIQGNGFVDCISHLVGWTSTTHVFTCTGHSKMQRILCSLLGWESWLAGGWPEEDDDDMVLLGCGAGLTGKADGCFGIDAGVGVIGAS